VVLMAVIAGRLGIERSSIGRLISVIGRGQPNPGRKVMTPQGHDAGVRDGAWGRLHR
jgi:hypothetical protein